MNTQLDIRHAPFTSQGLAGLLWPLSFERQKAFADHLLYGTVDIVREGLGKELGGARELMAVPHYVLPQAITGFAWEMVRSGFAAHGAAVQIPDDVFRQWTALQQGKPLDWRRHWSAVMEAFEPHDFGYYFKKYLSRLVGLFAQGAWAVRGAPGNPDGPVISRVIDDPKIPSRKSSSAFSEEEIAVTKRSRLISRHAATTDARTVFVQQRRWFRPISERELRSRMRTVLHPEIKDALLELVRSGFVLHGHTEPPAYLLQSFKRTLDVGVTLAAIHLERLGKRGVHLPRQLWTGSAGNLWDRLLRIAVHERGGLVTGHDHAGGVNYMQDPGPFISQEFAACSRYVTYSEKQAEAVRLITDGLETYQPKPDIGCVPAADGPGSRLLEVGPKRVIKKVLYVGGLYRGDIIFFFPNIQNVVMADFEARMFGWLLAQGYEVLYKPHPATAAQVPGAFANMGVKVLSGTFEEAAHLADVLIFPHAATTTFNLALRTDLPMVLLDFGQWEWRLDAREQLMKRCAVADCSVDDRNVLQCDWNRLSVALSAAPELVDDTEFLSDWL